MIIGILHTIKKCFDDSEVKRKLDKKIAKILWQKRWFCILCECVSLKSVIEKYHLWLAHYRALAPLVFGGVYSWSMTNVKNVYPDGLGFPFNQYLTFFFISFMSILSAIAASFFPDRLNYTKQKQLEMEMEQEESHASVIWIWKTVNNLGSLYFSIRMLYLY